jgi:hypothetical protein
MQEKYDQTGNEELNTTFLALKLKMENRICVNLGNKLFELRKKVENRIKSKKYDEADIFLSEALELIEKNPNCELKTEKLENIKEVNQPAFDFYHKLGIAELAFSTGNYTSAVSTYYELEKKYHDNRLDRFGIEEPDMRKFVAKKESADLTTACVEYFVQDKQYEEAFFYLSLLKGLGVSPKDAKSLQTDVGSGIAQTNDYLKPVENYTKGAKWFRYFKKAYLKY